MYDRPETAPALDRLWAGMRDLLGRGPERLTRGVDFWRIWQDRDLLIGQTCGLPYRTRLHGRVGLVASPVHGLTECPDGYYRSVLVVRGGESRGLAELSRARLAYNEAGSQSGWAAVASHFAALGLRLEDTRASGSHRASAQMVAEGRADIAGLDAVTWELIRAHDSFADALKVIARTEPTPALPFITGPDEDPAEIRASLAGAIAGLDLADRALLHLHGVREIPASAYLAVPTPPGP